MSFEDRLRPTIQFVGGLRARTAHKYICDALATRKNFLIYYIEKLTAIWHSEITATQNLAHERPPVMPCPIGP